jgi:hypothetical protein
MKLYMDRMSRLVAAELLYALVGVVASDESVGRFTRIAARLLCQHLM